jgi:hypothetical protein
MTVKAEIDLASRLYASVEVIKSQQTEIYRRLGVVEKKLEEGVQRPESLVEVVKHMELLSDRLEQLEGSDPWYKRPFWAALMGGLGLAASALVANWLGVDLPAAF